MQVWMSQEEKWREREKKGVAVEGVENEGFCVILE